MGVGLSDAVVALRAELVTAMAAGQSGARIFELGPVELEFIVARGPDGVHQGVNQWHRQDRLDA
jgi:hypothetical protein